MTDGSAQVAPTANFLNPEALHRPFGAALQAVGASFDQVVKLSLYLVDITQLPAVREVRRLAVDGLLVEVEAVAVIAEDKDSNR
jgi:enamine deaminase RidA (YjgF/YER057c/UK114 family)